MDVHSVAAVRTAEAALLAALPADTLMERAAFGAAAHCAKLLRRRRGRVYGARVTVLAGTGNNGGDARWAGRLLARWGATVRHWEQTDNADTALADADLVLDGLVGIGGQGPLRPALHPIVAAANVARERGALLVALDVPSGVDADTGLVLGPAIEADATITFGCHKPGNLVTPGAWHAGELQLVDIGLELPAQPVARLAAHPTQWPRPRRSDSKYSRGVVGIVAGSSAYPGAAVLAVGGARAVGVVGMVRYVGPIATVVQSYPDVVTTPNLAATGRVQAWLIGPGLATDDAAAAAVHEVLRSELPVVIDASALAVLAADPRRLDAIRRRTAPTVLTPHEGEFTRLFGPPTDGRLDAVRAAAAFLRAVVVLKGDRTLVAAPDEPAWIGPGGAAGLATAGSGDVLAGAIAALLASGCYDGGHPGAARAAIDGVLRHAAAAIRLGEQAITASDLINSMGSETA